MFQMTRSITISAYQVLNSLLLIEIITPLFMRVRIERRKNSQGADYSACIRETDCGLWVMHFLVHELA